MEEVIRKLKFKSEVVVINAPLDLEKKFVRPGFSKTFKVSVKSTNTLVFINNLKEFMDFLRSDLEFVEPDSILWFAYPKGSSGIKTDIHRDILRMAGAQFGLSTVAAISINDTWSALRFRPVEKVGK